MPHDKPAVVILTMQLPSHSIKATQVAGIEVWNEVLNTLCRQHGYRFIKI